MEYKQVYSEEGNGSYGNFGIKILIAIDIDLKEFYNGSPAYKDINNSLYSSVENIKSSVMEHVIKSNQKYLEDSKQEKENILQLFPLLVFVEEIPNGYCNQWCCKHKPWFIVTTLKGRIKIGWRKRVLNIDWSDSIITQKAEELFPNENVTKDNKLIHAWSYEKAAEYITKLMSI